MSKSACFGCCKTRRPALESSAAFLRHVLKTQTHFIEMPADVRAVSPALRWQGEEIGLADKTMCINSICLFEG